MWGELKAYIVYSKANSLYCANNSVLKLYVFTTLKNCFGNWSDI